MNTIRDFCASLFIGFKAVLFTDADELAVVDPDVAPTLSQYVADRDVPPVLDLFGSDVRHVEGEARSTCSAPFRFRGALSDPFIPLQGDAHLKRTDWHIGFHCVVHDHRPNSTTCSCSTWPIATTTSCSSARRSATPPRRSESRIRITSSRRRRSWTISSRTSRTCAQTRPAAPRRRAVRDDQAGVRRRDRAQELGAGAGSLAAAGSLRRIVLTHRPRGSAAHLTAGLELRSSRPSRSLGTPLLPGIAQPRASRTTMLRRRGRISDLGLQDTSPRRISGPSASPISPMRR